MFRHTVAMAYATTQSDFSALSRLHYSTIVTSQSAWVVSLRSTDDSVPDCTYRVYTALDIYIAHRMGEEQLFPSRYDGSALACALYNGTAMRTFTALPSMQIGKQIREPYRKQRDENEWVENENRFAHTFCNGLVGTGKTTFLERSAIEDAYRGDGLCFFDFTGQTTRKLLLTCPPERQQDFILLNACDTEFPVGLNPIEGDFDPALVASSLVDTVKDMWDSGATPQLDLYLRTGALAMSEMQDGTLLGLAYLIQSPTYRCSVNDTLTDPILRDVWEYFDKLTKKEQFEQTISLRNRLLQLITDPLIRNIIGQPKSTLDFKDIIEKGQVLIVQLPQGQLGKERASLLANLILSRLFFAARRREKGPPFHIYLDNAHLFGHRLIKDMLSTVAEYRVSLNLSARYLDEMTPELQRAVLGTVGTLVCFSTSPYDQPTLEPSFQWFPNTDIYNLANLPPFTSFARVEGRTWLLSMPPVTADEDADMPQIIRNRCRMRFAKPRMKVEDKIRRFVESA